MWGRNSGGGVMVGLGWWEWYSWGGWVCVGGDAVGGGRQD